jgi:hypothetical protein
MANSRNSEDEIEGGIHENRWSNGGNLLIMGSGGEKEASELMGSWREKSGYFNK